MNLKGEPLNSIRGKKVLVFGLGLLGGGVATTNWLIKQGAHVTVCDPKTERELAASIKKIRGPVKLRHGVNKVKLELGRQTKKQIDENEIIVVNQGVPVSHPLIQYALKTGKLVEKEATIFFKQFKKPIIGVTGTRGKTTTVAWIRHLLDGKSRAEVVGNSPTNQFLKMINRKIDVAVCEMPSFQLDLFGDAVVSPVFTEAMAGKPNIAVITNIYVDHVNWHGSMEAYVDDKANLFKHQEFGQVLILSADNKWTPYLLKKKPKSHIWFFSLKPLAKSQNGVFYRHNAIYYQFDGRAHPVLKLGDFSREMGEHNLENLLASSLAAFLAGVPGSDIQKKIPTLPGIPFRQETVFRNNKLRIINDTTATSPEGGIAALKRFKGPSTILITGGTDRGLDYKEWAKVLPKYIRPSNVIFLDGSATDKMRKMLRVPLVVDNLEECLKIALEKASKYSKAVVLFSPASKSFEKFKNEYDRGEQFNKLVKKLVR